jgi:hypothetical protein
MNWLDWVVALCFTGLLAALGYVLLLQTYGIFLGAVAAILLLYMAKKRRDSAYEAAEKVKENDQDSPKDAK